MATPRAKGWRRTAELAKDAESEDIEEREREREHVTEDRGERR
jgi:hypothetical protein